MTPHVDQYTASARITVTSEQPIDHNELRSELTAAPQRFNWRSFNDNRDPVVGLIITSLDFTSPYVVQVEVAAGAPINRRRRSEYMAFIDNLTAYLANVYNPGLQSGYLSSTIFTRILPVKKAAEAVLVA